MVTDDHRYLSQPNETNYIHVNAGIRLRLWRSPPVNTEPHGGQIERKDTGTELSVELAILYHHQHINDTLYVAQHS